MSEYKKRFLAPVKPMGLPWWLALMIVGVVFAAEYTGALSADLAGCFALMLCIGIVCDEIGERIPFWNTYIGGGIVMTYIVSAFLFTYKVIPDKYVKGISNLMDSSDFLSFFIVFLIVGSVLALDRKMLIRSFAGYLPAIFGGLIGAGLLGVLGGLIFGVNPVNVLIKYMLPIMGGGNGAGAVPLSQIYETVTGDPAANYYTFAITILTIANVFAIISGALLKKLGTKKTTWTGDGTELMRKGGNITTEDKDVKPSMKDLGGAFLLGLAFYALGRLFAKVILPTIGGAPIHQFAYMIIFVAIVAATGIVPDNIRTACKTLQNFFTKNLILVIMVGVAVDTNINDLIAAITPSNMVIALLVVIGAIIGSALVGYWVGFYPIDSAITAGLCMANRGGSGDLAVLGAADRMGLIAYAQLSSRLGGGIVLIIGSVMFGAFLK
ncbi:MAG: 2-hydroxycarboxylate transporter family protein [Clostridiales bacterium]|jgi:Na+/citrate or Na+/malate symporter|nr:2-hydroxycarboxylate transporter family protein [Clostridiales bacterium]MCI2161412.1 2-hydroxycarboxylate transporter family protein [Oscillospiraceae bacterium]MCI1962014.1 2-hydroxycarboxylate transporter family protein [Clostridiales bacterium]MCI2022253.1 2-hydroxycarboxylate transporter family protein [Clostridiales bacterium]MCI2026650.1 2-hydroxycarboxylate transporter family protein [Clostridiales bacterium]